MEGKKCRVIYQDCRAVSEVYGQLLMISIVVIAFSGIALTVFSDGGAVKPEHTPHTDLQENFNRSTNTIQITHSGGEAIDISAIKIMVSVNGEKKGEFDRSDFSVKNPDGNPSSDEVFTLGDCIEIDTKSMDLKAGEDIDLFFVDTPSRQVIQRAVLQRGSWELPYWITPHPYGSVLSNSTNDGGWQSTELVSEIKDGLLTDSFIPQDDWVTENYTFGIDSDEMGIPDPLKLVQLKIIYNSHDNSVNTQKLCIFNGSTWIQIAPSAEYPDRPAEFNSIDACVEANDIYDITQHVKTTAELDKLEVSFSDSGNAANTSAKTGWVDFVGIHVEF